MSTLKQCADNLINVFGGFISTDDLRLNSDQLEFWLNQYRAQLFPQFTDYGKSIDSALYQDLGIWEVAPVDKAEDIALDYGQTILRTVNKIPALLQLPQHRGQWVGALDKQTGYVWTEPENVIAKISNPLAVKAGVKWCYLKDQYVYITNSCTDTLDQSWINLRLCLQDPSQGHYYYSNGTGIPFDRKTTYYPMNDAFLSQITALIGQKEFGIAQATIDPSNNSADIPNQNKPNA